MADSLPPTTDEELAAIERRIDAFTGSDHYRYTVDGIEYDAHWAHDTRRLLDENARLNAENDDMRKRVAFAAAVISGDAAEMLDESLTKVRAELDRVIREAAANKAKLAAVRVEPPELAAIRERVDRDFVTDPGSVSGELAAELMQARIDRRALLVNFDAELAEHAKPAPEMPRPPAEESAMAPDEETEDAIRGQHQTTVRGGNWVSLRCDCREWELEVPAGLDAMPRLKAAHAEHVAEMVAEGARLAAQKPVSGPETAGTGSGRGTGVAETPGTAQVGDAWREFSRVIDEEEPDDILAAALDIPGLWADENQPEAPAEAEHVTAVRSTYRPGYASVLLRLIADAETTTPYYRRPVIVQDGAITDAGFLRDAVAAVWGAMPHLLPSLPVPSTERGSADER